MLVRGDKKKLFFAVLLLCAVFLRIICLLICDNFHGIAAGKIIEARRLIQHPELLNSWIVPAHGPVHMYLVALAIFVSGNAEISARALSLLCGILFLIPYYGFLRLSFDEETALICLTIAVFFPMHIVYSVLSTAETMFLLFLFSGIYFFAKYRNLGQEKDLMSAAFLVGTASMCRFEGGLYIAVLALFLLRKPRSLLVFLGLASLLPVLWMWGNFLISGNFMQFLYSSDTIVKTEYSYLRSMGEQFTMGRKFFYWPLQLYSYFGAPVFIGGITGIVISFRQKKHRYIAGLLLGILGFFIYKTIKEELAMQPRYGISLGFLFLPFFAVFFITMLKRISQGLRRGTVCAFLLYVLVGGTYVSLLSLPHNPQWVKEAAIFLHRNLQPLDKIYVETDEQNAKAPLKNYLNIGFERFVDDNPFAQKVELLDPLERVNLRYIVLVSKRELKKLREVFRYDNCKIYRVENAR